MRRMIQKTFLSMGLSAVRHTELDKVRALLASLSPEDCGKELIRIGGDTDGGYLIPDGLEGLEYRFSPGVSTVADFENHLADRGINSFLADYSVVAPPITRPEFVFDKKFLEPLKASGTSHSPRGRTSIFAGMAVICF